MINVLKSQRKMSNNQNVDLWGLIVNNWGQLMAAGAALIWGSRMEGRVKNLEIADDVKTKKLESMDEKLDDMLTSSAVMQNDVSWVRKSIEKRDNK